MAAQQATKMALRCHIYTGLTLASISREQRGTFGASGGWGAFAGAKEHSASSSVSLALRCCSNAALFLLLASARRSALPS